MALPGPRAAARAVLKLTCTPSIKLSEQTEPGACPALGVGVLVSCSGDGGTGVLLCG